MDLRVPRAKSRGASAAAVAFALSILASCVPPQDDPSQVIDLRVLGIQFEPPELMAPDCRALLALAGNDGGTDVDLTSLLVFARPVTMKWLILDPKGANRDLSYEIRACANQSDFKCENEGDFVSLASGTTKAGELTKTLAPGFTFVNPPADGGTGDPLLLEVVTQDAFKGFGGIRMPIVIHLKAGAEDIYAQKLMVFSCKAFPSMKPNVNPVLPGMLYSDVVTRGSVGDAGILWGEMDLPQFTGKDGGVRFEPPDFSDRQEPYTVPTFQLKPLELVESWQISWHADLGRIAPLETGGVGLDGEEGRHFVTWNPLQAENTERDVNYWFVVRDGRGGQSWIHRTAHWKPAPQ